MRDLITLVCDGCKRKNYTSTKNKKKTTEKLALQEVLPGVPEPHAAQGGQGLRRRLAAWGSVALIG